jgi:CheY-like chemotaxis protein
MARKATARKRTGRGQSERKLRSSRSSPKAIPAGDQRSATVTGATTDRPGRPGPVVVAVLNSNQDVLRLIRSTLQDEGYAVVTEHIISFRDGDANLTRFLRTHHPSVVLYDLAPPYQENWNFLQLLCKIPEIAAIPMVLTTVNKRALENTVGKTNAFEFLGTRDNLGPVVAEINRSVRLRRRSGIDGEG